jgi:hypothetical protein
LDDLKLLKNPGNVNVRWAPGQKVWRILLRNLVAIIPQMGRSPRLALSPHFSQQSRMLAISGVLWHEANLAVLTPEVSSEWPEGK